MLIESARRAEAAVKEMLDIANEGSATTDELHDALEISKSVVGIATAFQTSAAAAVAGREHHGDGVRRCWPPARACSEGSSQPGQDR